MTLEERLMSHVKVVGECWIWQGHLNEDGYAHAKIDGRVRRVHRALFEIKIGPIADGLELDHGCENRACVFPGHMEPVTHKVNVLRGKGYMAKLARQTHCKRGHEFTPENTIIENTGRGRTGRRCRQCNAVRRKRT